ncbi:hypothetical protein GWN26_09245 [Candidatus Saccharibacteria bacterium]|nr:hypothetical protein [Candidatus Saccharibacteria bacterium]NIS51223.1 hypothetical protein [Phycisphaerae bacterium]NIV04601.1 hypothetical protein [Calditrichia bacterium]NIS39154.1 hypothetical protein [Candidatus Saccharibacteria bacterium]NIV73231.1 hypothetical protein [Calditrichia bacterium]
MQEIALGQYSIPVILTVVLTLIYKMTVVPDRVKALVAIGIGVVLGIIGMVYNAAPPYTAKLVIDYALYGFMTGAAAVGLYEGVRTFSNPRS